MDSGQELTPDQARLAVPQLEQAARDGNAGAAFLLAKWYLAGRLVPRDIPSARTFYERAAALGHDEARMIALGWQAGGTGGPADWLSSIAQLRDLAKTNPQAAAEIALIDTMSLTADGYPQKALPGEQLSESPWARYFRGFATDKECAHLVAVAGRHLRPAEVGNPAMPGGPIHNPVRTCQSMGFPLVGESPFIHAINRRIAAASETDVLQGEPTQIFHYAVGEEFRPHLDSSTDFANQRCWTFLLYLNDDYEGGETLFLSSGLKFKGLRGDALLFRNVDAAGDPDPASKHAGLPVTKGAKWLLSRWIREKPIDLDPPAAIMPPQSR